MNQASNTLDLSQLYGVSEEDTNNLRSFKNGELRSSNDPLYPTLPEAEEGETHYCMHNHTADSDAVCYKSGDSRVNINPYMTTLYTIFLRSHNKLAREIRKSKKMWNDERVFQMARRINVAIYQKIIYSEWADVIVGASDAQFIRTEPFSTKFKKSARAVSNEFATAGIRFYYSMIPGELRTTRDINYFVRQNNIVIRPLTE